MKMKKGLSLFCTATIMLGVMAGCSNGANEGSKNNGENAAAQTNNSQGTSTNSGTDTEPAAEPEKKEPVEIDFWHVYSEGPMKDLYEKLIADFQKEHDYITVKSLGVSFWDYWTKLSTAVAGGSGPDLALNDTSTALNRAKSGVILNLDSYIQRDGIKLEDYFPVLVDRVKYNGSMYAMPNDTDVRLLFYNKAAFREVGLDPEKPPTNWDELEQYADKLTIVNEDKMLDRVGFSPTMGNLNFWTLAWTNGGDFWDDSLKPTYNKPENVETLQWMAKIQGKYGSKALQAFNTQNGALQMSPFIAGRVAMIVDVNNLYGDIKRNKPDMEFGVAPIPFQKQNASWSAGFDLEIIDNKDQAQADAAWELMKYLTSVDVQKQIHRESGSLVSNMLAAKDAEFISDPVWKMVVDQMDSSRFIEYVEGSPSWHASLSPKIDEVLQGKKDAQAALDEAQQAIEKELENYAATQ
ncbi:ABC transporter substrate-binding protein [Paenibacillus montanisoli]|uniref:ABC transporter substrate-binding protein n=1 Tax=Paenibacillus montanisoli TaxID=2081970 RepID=A0A328TWL4_9BACL|nr:ABC transporter substrate-binding protein [Paenibacillus montanisoli]RAP74062.1 hypothetical protein DL346_23600 [Paenibacillus montanisoli]